ncbi:MAG: hypothetical protein Q7T05_07220, partial [Dehalococcoidia bacterium]|nr:hypothetical protein [Dehalococcoidia bacterium]
MTTGEKKVARIQGRYDLDLTKHVISKPGIRWDWLIEDMEEDAPEHRMRSIEEFRLAPLANAEDIAEWDIEVVNKVHPPMYALSKGQNEQGAALESLKDVLAGSKSQMLSARRALDYATNKFPRDKKVTFGSQMDNLDGTFISMLAGFHPWSLERLGAAMKYAEDQVKRAEAVAADGKATVPDLESHSMHVGSMVLISQEILELIKVTFFGYSSAGSLSLADVAWYPLPIWTGRGMMEKGKRSVVFVGDDFIPMSLFVDRLKASNSTEKYEVCGIGQAGDDLPRFYDRARWTAPMVRAKKVLRTGVFDVIVGSDACMYLDLIAEAKRTNSKLVWIGANSLGSLKDRSSDAADAIARDVLGSEGAAWVKDMDKAAEVIAKVLEGTSERKGSYVMDEAKAKAEASRCRENCDLCSYSCPNAVMISRGIKAIKRGEGLKSLSELEKNCCLFGKCDNVCPEKIPISDMMVAAYAQKAPNDKFLFRAGRIFATNSEIRSYGYTAFPGNCPGWFAVVGCGRSNPEDLQWMANDLASRNGIVSMAGCTAGDIGHYYDADDRKWFMQKYPYWMQPRACANYGGCSACMALPMVTVKYSRGGTGVTTVANYVENVDIAQPIFVSATIVWGSLPERMYSIVRGLIRSGQPVVVGPVSGLEEKWKGLMPGNKWDWKRYYSYDALTRKKRVVEPFPKHMLMVAETKEEAVNMACGYEMMVMTPFIMRMAIL